MNHRLDGAADEHGRVIVDLVADALGEGLRQLLHGGAHRIGELQRIRTRQLEDGDGDRGTAVEHAAQGIVVRAEFEPRDVAQVRGLAVRPVLDHDVLEFLLGLQAALGIDDILELGSRHRRLAADLAGRNLHVLFAHRVQHLIDIHAAGRDLGRIEPQAHRIVARAEHLDIAHAP